MRNRRIGFTPSVLLNFWACIGFIVFPAQPAFACTCAPPESPGEELKRATAVFAGEVSALKTEESSIIVSIKVEKVWKGAIGREIVVRTSKWESDCGYPFAKAKKYLIYVNGDAPYLVSLCSRTKPLESASNDLRELGEGKRPN